jgi:secreted Zn-dependent insulinase-like peptidase
MREQIANLSDEKFETIRSSVLTTISEKDKNLNEEFNRFWSHEFATHKYKFDR